MSVTIGKGAPRSLRGGAVVIFGAKRPPKRTDPVQAAPMTDAEMRDQYEMQRRMDESLRRKDDDER